VNVRPSKRFPEICIGLLIAASILLVYAQVASHCFVLFDDTMYVTNNYFVLQGFTGESVKWALTNCDLANWQPLTFLSHMLDIELWGLRAGGHALTNVLLHGVASVLLFILAFRLTGHRWAGAFVALVFAIHPANVESVAWIAERKNVLSAVFWIATFLVYLDYVAKPSWCRYGVVLLSFALALAAKPVAVTLPCVLLLLDWWPLGRSGGVAPLPQFAALPSVSSGMGRRMRWLVIEKLPLLAMSAVLSLVTYWAQQNIGAMTAEHLLPLPERVAHAGVGVLEYLRMFAFPGKLAVLYPLDAAAPPSLAAAAVVGGGLVGACVVFRRFPPVFVGICWFLGVLVPMLGLVQVGSQRMADRYLYLPMMGLALGIVWLVAAIPLRWRWYRLVLGLVSVPWLAWLGWRAYAQVETWQDDRTLCEQTVTERGIPRMMANNLALDAESSLRGDDAAKMLGSIPAADVVARRNLGGVYLYQGRYEAAIPLLEEGIKVPSAPAQIHFHLARAYAAVGRIEEARRQVDICRAKIPPKVQWRNSIEILRRIVNAPGFSVEQLVPADRGLQRQLTQ
jgi:hypothetical protein